MDMFVANDEVERWEGVLAELQNEDRLTALTTLAWYLRQRDTRRAIKLADEALVLAQQRLPETCTERSKELCIARLNLVRAEAQWLFSELNSAQQLAELALLSFEQLGDTDGHQGCADARFLLAWIALYRGEMSEFEVRIEQAIVSAAAANDAVREFAAQTFLAVQKALQDLPMALQRWGSQYSPDANPADPVIAGCHNEFLTYVAHLSSDFGHAAAYGMQLYELALQTGQIRRAITAATNVGDAFNSLNDHQAALPWMQRSYDLAKRTGWPNSISSCQTRMAETMRRLGRLDTAKELMEEAIPVLSSVAGSRSHLLALRHLGDLSLDRKEYPEALSYFHELQERSDEKNQLDFRIGARRGRAHALSMLDLPQDALVVAQEALILAKQSADSIRQIDIYRVLAEIYQRHDLPAPASMAAVNAPLHYLQLAIDTAASIHGYTVPGELLEKVAEVQASAGNHVQAYRLSRLAIVAHEKIYNQEATNRATAMQLSHQTERMRAESEYLRQLAAGEAQRAEVLQQTSAVLERLGAIGQEITACLDASAVFQTLNRHVHGILHVTAFVIYLMEPDQQSMVSVFGIENGLPIVPDTILMSNSASRSVQCIHDRHEILVEFSPEDEILGLVPGTERVLSVLFAPLILGERVLGVMTIQSSRQRAYGEREKMTFRSLCAYGAIALGNADAYLRLKETQAHLVAQEKLAALGSMVAGVAHELNTPIGNSLLVASTLQDNTKTAVSKLNEQTLRRSDLQTYFEDVKTTADIIMRGLSSAATLISSFKQVAVDRTSEQRRIFDVQQVMQDIIATLNIRIGHAGHIVTLNIPANIKMDSYPGSLGQVITNLVENAILHAFENGQTGTMTLTALQTNQQRVLIQFTDDGVGISEGNLKRVFDPFFTTKLGQGGSGLGLNICHNIVTSIMRGQLSVSSKMGVGTNFQLDLPLVLPLVV
jgi:signal transduction histidine kinase/tetratricopeptide (TPR) repeat protein